jgi:hypothetical protein
MAAGVMKRLSIKSLCAAVKARTIMPEIAQDRPTWHNQTLLERRIYNAAAAR